MNERGRGRTEPLIGWRIVSAALVAWSIAIALLSSRFGYDGEVIDMPILAVTGMLGVAGAAYFYVIPSLAQASPGARKGDLVSAMPIMLAAGLIARLVMFASEPILEDDYQRYLWDGAVTANGYDPYKYAPAVVVQGGSAHPLAAMAADSGKVLERIGHAELTTIYPPLTQAAFALAYFIAPFSLAAWRLVLLAADVATLSLLLALLRTLSRSPLWAAVYWCNPIVIKELFNSAHMDGLIAPFVIASLLLAQSRPRLATSALGVAFGIKFWPIILLPLIWRPLWRKWRQLASVVLIFAVFAVVGLWPQLSAGLDRGSGLIAYASSWDRNSALIIALESTIGWAIGGAWPSDRAPLLARGLLAAAMISTIVVLSWRPTVSLQQLVARATVAVGALVLLSPAQYPWYSTWLAPLLALHPISGFLLLPVTLPLYELFFFFSARRMDEVFRHYIVWLSWLPVWATLLFVDVREWWRKNSGKRGEPLLQNLNRAQ